MKKALWLRFKKKNFSEKEWGEMRAFQTVFWYISTATKAKLPFIRALTKGLNRYFVRLLVYFDANVRRIIKSAVSGPGIPPDCWLHQRSEGETGSWTQHIRARVRWALDSDTRTKTLASSRARSASALLSAWWCCRKEERGISHHATLLIPRDGRTDGRTLFEVSEALRSSRFGSFKKWHRIRLNRT